MRKILIGTASLLLAVATFGAILPQQAAAGFRPSPSEVLPWVESAINGKSKRFKLAQGSLDAAQHIVKDGMQGLPKPEFSPGNKVPHFLVTTKAGAVYKVKFKKEDLLGRRITITVSKPNAPEPADEGPPK
jgi:hypothetical protein